MPNNKIGRLRLQNLLAQTTSMLIDDIQLAQLMIDYNLGVSVQRTYEIKRLDNDYFEEV